MTVAVLLEYLKDCHKDSEILIGRPGEEVRANDVRELLYHKDEGNHVFIS